MIKIQLNCDDICPDDLALPQMVSAICEAVGKAGGIGEITMICSEDDDILWDLTEGAYLPSLAFMNTQ